MPPRRIDPSLPETLEAITLKCLAKNPAERYPSAQDLRVNLRRYLEGGPASAERALMPADEPSNKVLARKRPRRKVRQHTEASGAIQPATRAHVFVSYSSSDGAYVERLLSHFGQNGILAWTDDGIEHGSRWKAAIKAAMQHSFAVAVVMTPSAETSDWVDLEVQLAQELKKPLVPLLLEGDRWWTLAHIQYESVLGGIMPSSKYVTHLHTLARDFEKAN